MKSGIWTSGSEMVGRTCENNRNVGARVIRHGSAEEKGPPTKGNWKKLQHASHHSLNLERSCVQTGRRKNKMQNNEEYRNRFDSRIQSKKK